MIIGKFFFNDCWALVYDCIKPGPNPISLSASFFSLKSLSELGFQFRATEPKNQIWITNSNQLFFVSLIVNLPISINPSTALNELNNRLNVKNVISSLCWHFKQMSCRCHLAKTQCIECSLISEQSIICSFSLLMEDNGLNKAERLKIKMRRRNHFKWEWENDRLKYYDAEISWIMAFHPFLPI